MTRELKFVLLLGAGMLLLAEFAATAGLARSPLMQFASAASALTVAVPLCSLLTYCLFLHAALRPAWREIGTTFLGGAVLGAILYAVLWQLSGPAAGESAITIIGGGFGTASLAAVMVWARRGSRDARSLLFAGLSVMLLALYVSSYLDITSSLHPATFDFAIYRIDLTLGFNPSVTLASIAGHWPLFGAALLVAYNMLPYACLGTYALQLSSGRRPPANFLLIWAVSTAIAALVGYHAYPVAGPNYAFGAEVFPAYMPPTEELPLAAVVIPPAPRNGVPSMHFGWILSAWINASWLPAGKVADAARALAALMLGLTGLATLATGEHYLLDLVVAVPFIVAIQALCTRVLPWDNASRVRALAVGATVTLLWIVLLRLVPEAFIDIPGLTWAAVIATIAASVWVYRPLKRAALEAAYNISGTPAVDESAPARVDAQPARLQHELRYVAVMFVISGFAGLMYQVLFSKELALVFGSTSTATYTVLATYMGGMAIGAWLGGKLAARHAVPLKLYAWCELGIGVFCLATPLLFQGIQALYVALALGVAPDAGALTAFRVMLGAGVLMVPTVLMGMTLPILARFFEARAQSLGASVAVLYGANTLGAAFGALVAGYFIIPLLGVFRTTLLAALANFAVVLLALNLAKIAMPAQPTVATGGMAGTREDPEARRIGVMALVVLAAGGVVTLALEVVYIHLLAVVAGNSVYAFSLMLFAFLLGLGGGAEAVRHLLRVRVPLPQLLAWLEWGLAAAILGGVFLWSGLPDYFASFRTYPLVREFGAREVVRGLVCLVAMFPPALFIGAIYPVAMECVGRAQPGRPIWALGRAAALNTAGNIIGVLLAGFLLLPWLGALGTIQLLAIVSAVLGVYAMALYRPAPDVAATKPTLMRRHGPWVPAVLVAVLFISQPRSFDYAVLASGANVYFARQSFGRVIDHAESVDGGLTTVAAGETAQGGRVLTLLTNGKFQGNNSIEGEMQAQVGFALSPLLHTQHREHALVIGFGTGVSARTLHAAGFKALDVVDLSADIIRLATEHFANVNDRVTAKPGVNTYVTDGRNFLLLQERQYDVVSMEISSIWFAGAASLYNREFYQLVKRRLAPHGVLQQWMQLHHLQPVDILYIIGSLRAEFDHVWLYLIGGQGMLIASNDPGAQPTEANAAKLDATPGLKALLAPQEGRSAKALLETRLLDPAGTDRFLGGFNVPASFWVSTDDNLRLEYSTPKGNVLDGSASFRHNLELIQRYTAAAPRPE